MGRVGDNHIRFRDILHHTAPRCLAHTLTLSAFYFRISLCIFVLVLDLLFGHLHLFIKTVFLIDEISNSDNEIHQADLEPCTDNHISTQCDRLI